MFSVYNGKVYMKEELAEILAEHEKNEKSSIDSEPLLQRIKRNKDMKSSEKLSSDSSEIIENNSHSSRNLPKIVKVTSSTPSSSKVTESSQKSEIALCGNHPSTSSTSASPRSVDLGMNYHSNYHY